MVDSESLLPTEKQKDQSSVSRWVSYLSLILAIIAILLAVMGAFKKVIILLLFNSSQVLRVQFSILLRVPMSKAV